MILGPIKGDGAKWYLGIILDLGEKRDLGNGIGMSNVIPEGTVDTGEE